METNKLDSFEQFVKETLSTEEVAYNSSDWNDLSKRLDALSPKPFYKSKWFLGGAAVAVLGLSTYAFYPSSNNVVEEDRKLVELVEKNTEVSGSTVEEKSSTSVITTKEVASEVVKNELKENKNIASETISKKNKAGNEVDNNHQPPQNASLPEYSSSNTQKNDLNQVNEVIIDRPIADFKVTSGLTGCKGLMVDFEANEQPNVKYLWSFGDGTYSSELKPTHKYTQSGKFKVDLIVQSTLDDKIMEKSSGSVLVTVYDDPTLEIVADKEINKGITTISYTAVGDEVGEVFWSFGNGKTSNQLEASTVYKKRGNYKVMLEVANEHGCKSIVEKSVFVEDDYNLLAPNAFTPDGDGLNDLFIPEALKSMDCNFTMVIRSRTEGIVFESTSLDRPWDGKNQKTGMDCPETNYVWIVNLINEAGEKEQYTGTILIRR